MSKKEKLSKETPEIYALKQDKSGWQFSRREFLATSGAAVVALAAAGCSPDTTSDTEPAVQCSLDEGLRAHETEVDLLAISPDSSLLATAADEKTVKLWSLPEGELLKTVDTGQSYISYVIFSPDGKLLATAGRYGTKLWSMPEGELFKDLTGHEGYINDLVISADGTQLISASSDNTVKVWSLPDGELLQTLENFPGILDTVAISPDTTRLAVLLEDDEDDERSIHLWSIPEDRSLAVLEGEWRMVFSPDGTLLALPDDMKVRLYSALDGALIKTLEGHEDKITRYLFTPDSSLLITGSSGESSSSDEGYHSAIKFWSMPDGKLKKTLKSREEKDTILTVSPNSEWLATLNSDKYNTFTRFWSLPNGRLKRDRKLGSCDHLAFSPDGNLLVQAREEMVRLYSWPDGILLNCLMDLESMSPESEGIEYEATGESGGTVTRYLPCGSALPPGAVCTCNCVSGSGCECVGYRSSGGGSHYWHPN